MVTNVRKLGAFIHATVTKWLYQSIAKYFSLSLIDTKNSFPFINHLETATYSILLFSKYVLIYNIFSLENR